MIEDTSPGAHDTLTAACDANLYTALGVDKPEEHGSCAENLVLALKELNEGAGLKGAKAVGADITVNIAPTPLHLFMNAPLETSNNADEGAGAKGTIVKVEEPKGKKRCHVRFRAERDVVVVFSACPNDVGPQNGGRCMAANFMVEDIKEGEDLASSVASVGKKKPKKLGEKKGGEGNKEETKKDAPAKEEPKKDTPEKDAPKDEAKEEPKKAADPPKKPAPRKLSTPAAKTPEPKKDEGKKQDPIPEAEESRSEAGKSEDSQPKRKPKKLQVRGKGS